MRRRFLALGAVTAILVSGCSSARHHATGPTTTTAVAASPDPDVIPAVITPAYVDSVFRVLNHVYGDATRNLVSGKAVTPDVAADLRSIFADPLYGQQISEAQQSLQGPISNVRADPSDAVTAVDRLLFASSDCILVQTTTTLAGVLIRPTPAPVAEYYELGRKQPGLDPGGRNPTPWVITFNADYLKPSPPPTRCAS